MRTSNPEILKIIAARNQRILQIAASDPNITIREIADRVHCHPSTVAVIFRQNGVNRKVGGDRRKKAVSRG